MPADSATRVARLIALVTGMAFVATTTAGCDTINDLLPGGGEPEVEVVVAETDLGPCLPTYGNEVLSASMSGDGSRIVFVSAKRPQTLPDEAAWRSSDRALYVLNISPEGTTETNLIATSWQRVMMNLPFIGATTFHLFTTYPIEPGWIVRHRRIQLLPYAAAFGLCALMALEEPLGLPAGSMMTLGFVFTMTLFAAS
ncbi:MAG: hypothetical protein ACK2T6_06795, partial [Anaerolineae bacterium]